MCCSCDLNLRTTIRKEIGEKIMRSHFFNELLLKVGMILILFITSILAGCNFYAADLEDDNDYYEEEYSNDETDYESEDKSGLEQSEEEEIPIIVTDGEGNTPPFGRDFKFTLPLFSNVSPWNQTTKDAAVLPESDQQILVTFRVLLGDYSSLEGYDGPGSEWPFMAINLYDFTVPIFLVGEGMQEVLICQDDGILGWAHPKFDIETEGGPVVVPAPAGTIRPSGPENGGADGWLVIYDPKSFISYDYFAATPFRDDECFGFEGGLVGDNSSDYFYPASTTETDFYNIDPYALASGQRIRLKQTLYDEDAKLIDEAELAPITKMYLAALRDYGAYLVDNAGGFTFYAEDIYTAVLDLADDKINALIGKPIGTPLPEGKTKWQIVMEKLGNDLELIPFAVGIGDEELDPESAEIEISNFEVVEPAYIP